MRCPKCGFITFDQAASCAKCKTNLHNVGGGFQGTSVNVKPPSLLGSVTRQAVEPSVDDLLDSQDVDFGNASDDAPSLDLMSDDEFEGTGDLSDIDLNELPILEEEAAGEDEIPSLEPLSADGGFDDEPMPQLKKIASELSDIDISDLVAASGSDDDAIPSLEPLGDEPLEDFTALEPFSDESTVIPELAPLDDMDMVPELSSPLSNDDSLDDLGLSADDFEDDELSSLLEDSGLDDFDVGGEVVEDFVASDDVQSLDHSLAFEEADDALSAELTEPEPLSSLEEEYDLSFDGVDDEPEPFVAKDTAALELSLELEEVQGNQPLKTPPPPISPDIPDLGLSLESDRE